MKSLLSILILLSLSFAQAMACTSVIVSGKATADGRPLMLKHRDTDDQNNSVLFFKGGKYDFIGLVNSDSPAGEVWTGTNSVGFSIMNTASYNFRDDTLDIRMDREGEVMYDALSVCATVDDFENLLRNRPKPMGVEANFGIIDAHGGAAYFEVNNFRWVKYDVNNIDCGYRVVTNFCESGRREDYKGWERYLIASEVMKNEFASDIDHRFFYNRLSRNTTELDGQRIPRKITSASIVIEGVPSGADPADVVMWTILGNPLEHIAYPLQVIEGTELHMEEPQLNVNKQLDLQKEEQIRTEFLSYLHSGAAEPRMQYSGHHYTLHSQSSFSKRHKHRSRFSPLTLRSRRYGNHGHGSHGHGHGSHGHGHGSHGHGHGSHGHGHGSHGHGSHGHGHGHGHR